MKTCKRCKSRPRVIGSAFSEDGRQYVCVQCLTAIEVKGLGLITQVVNAAPKAKERKPR